MKCAWPLCQPSPLSRFASLMRPLATPATVPMWTPSAPITSMFWEILSVVIWSLLCFHDERAVMVRLRRPQTPRSRSGGVPPRQLPVRADKVTGVAVRIAFQVILVLGFRLPEIASGRELGHDLARPQPRGLNVSDGFLGDAALFPARVENRRPVACASVV